MLEPSSSEESDEEYGGSGPHRAKPSNGAVGTGVGAKSTPTPAQSLDVPGGGNVRASSPMSVDGSKSPGPGQKANAASSGHSAGMRAGSPTSESSDKNLTEAQLAEKQEREEEERKKCIQLYVFVLRGIAYPFNAKQSADMQKRHLKVTREAHDKMKNKVEVSNPFSLYEETARYSDKLL